MALGRLHAGYRTPVVGIAVFTAIAWGLAVSGTFVQLAAVSALARLLFYGATCLAVPCFALDAVRRSPFQASGWRVDPVDGRRHLAYAWQFRQPGV